MRLEASVFAKPDINYEPAEVAFGKSDPAVRSVAFSSEWLSGPLVRRAFSTHRAFEVKTFVGASKVEVQFKPEEWRLGENASAQLVVLSASEQEPEIRVPIKVDEL